MAIPLFRRVDLTAPHDTGPMTKFLAIKKLNTLRPLDEAGEVALGSIGDGETVTVEIRKTRNPQHHRMFWALMTLVWDNLDHERYPTVENFVAAVKIGTGHRETVFLPNGKEIYIPKSISFSKMDQMEFGAFYDRVCDLIAEHWLPGVTSAELKAEVSIMIGAG